MKAIIQIIAVSMLTSLFSVGLFYGMTTLKPITVQTEPSQDKWEYTWHHFSRDDYREFNKTLLETSAAGWEYVGPMCNDGINGQFVLYKRLKKP